jgi:hypothetical protein
MKAKILESGFDEPEVVVVWEKIPRTSSLSDPLVGPEHVRMEIRKRHGDKIAAKYNEFIKPGTVPTVGESMKALADATEFVVAPYRQALDEAKRADSGFHSRASLSVLEDGAFED